MKNEQNIEETNFMDEWKNKLTTSIHDAMVSYDESVVDLYKRIDANLVKFGLVGDGQIENIGVQSKGIESATEEFKKQLSAISNKLSYVKSQGINGLAISDEKKSSYRIQLQAYQDKVDFLLKDPSDYTVYEKFMKLFESGDALQQMDAVIRIASALGQLENDIRNEPNNHQFRGNNTSSNVREIQAQYSSLSNYKNMVTINKTKLATLRTLMRICMGVISIMKGIAAGVVLVGVTLNAALGATIAGLYHAIKYFVQSIYHLAKSAFLTIAALTCQISVFIASTLESLLPAIKKNEETGKVVASDKYTGLSAPLNELLVNVSNSMITSWGDFATQIAKPFTIEQKRVRIEDRVPSENNDSYLSQLSIQSAAFIKDQLNWHSLDNQILTDVQTIANECQKVIDAIKNVQLPFNAKPEISAHEEISEQQTKSVADSNTSDHLSPNDVMSPEFGTGATQVVESWYFGKYLNQLFAPEKSLTVGNDASKHTGESEDPANTLGYN